jgi:hypothetical protein
MHAELQHKKLMYSIQTVCMYVCMYISTSDLCLIQIISPAVRDVLCTYVQMLQDIEENVGQQGQHTQAGHFLPFLQYLHSLVKYILSFRPRSHGPFNRLLTCSMSKSHKKGLNERKPEKTILDLQSSLCSNMLSFFQQYAFRVGHFS